MEAIKGRDQPKVTAGKQKVLLDPAITGETDELDATFRTGRAVHQKVKIKPNYMI
jgi:hypothetical protein